RPHLVALAVPRALGHVLGRRARHAAAFLDTLEVLWLAVALLDGPLRAAFEHRVHLRVVEPNPAGAADAGGDIAEELIRERLFLRLDIVQREPGVQSADAARNIEP